MNIIMSAVTCCHIIDGIVKPCQYYTSTHTHKVPTVWQNSLSLSEDHYLCINMACTLKQNWRPYPVSRMFANDTSTFGLVKLTSLVVNPREQIKLFHDLCLLSRSLGINIHFIWKQRRNQLSNVFVVKPRTCLSTGDTIFVSSNVSANVLFQNKPVCIKYTIFFHI